MSRSKSLLLVFLALVVSWIVPETTAADRAIPSQLCSKPPLVLEPALQPTNYQAVVDAYRRCLFDYRQGHERAAGRHLEAAEAATQDWNRFAAHFED